MMNFEEIRNFIANTLDTVTTADIPISQETVDEATRLINEIEKATHELKRMFMSDEYVGATDEIFDLIGLMNDLWFKVCSVRNDVEYKLFSMGSTENYKALLAW